eukprot:gb/GEZN01002366.1/.p1 GENE.gb/GEZN01002366.1/~~gb/GEZN01002366.1/.p1  ORF type:complete len:748 (-),score=162.37 gb/GEZN01002366.1/:215-2458(-)
MSKLKVVSVSKLTVVSVPDKALVWTNCAYVNPSGTSAPDNSLVMLRNREMGEDSKLPLMIKHHDKVNPGEIGLGAMQRKSLPCSNGDNIEYSIWTEPQSLKLNAMTVNLKVDLIQKTRATLKEDKLATFVKKRLDQHPVTRGQFIVLEFEGTPLQFEVIQVSVPDEKSQLTKFATSAVITAESDIWIDAEKNRLLTLEKAKQGNKKLLDPEWKFADMGIGGLDTEFATIFRRAFASRLFPPAIIQQLGIKHVKGMLLYGPPGTGKTLIARQIGKMLADTEPQIVNGPEILNKFVGASEENIRKLFEPAEADYKERGEEADLYIIIFDEIDAICKARGSTRGGTGVGDTVVNQLLSKIDGVDSPNNVLVIGMTNRKDMIDSALLRPGRLEVHVEIGLPDEAGRIQIFNIHTGKMRASGRLGEDVDLLKLAELTRNFSGAEIEGLVKSASSYALYGSVDVTKNQSAPTAKEDLDGIKVLMSDFLRALDEVEPAFGVQEDELKNLIRTPLLVHSDAFKKLMHTCRSLIQSVKISENTPLLSVLLEGTPGCGKTAIAAQLALESQFPFIKLISPETMVGMRDDQKAMDIAKVFDDAYKSPLSLVILDNLERLLEYVAIGPRFSNAVLQVLLVVLKRLPPVVGRKLVILATGSSKRVLHDLGLDSCLNVKLEVPSLKEAVHVSAVIKELDMKVTDADEVAAATPFPIGIKPLLMLLEMAKQQAGVVSPLVFKQCCVDAGLSHRSPSLDDYGD